MDHLCECYHLKLLQIKQTPRESTLGAVVSSAARPERSRSNGQCSFVSIERDLWKADSCKVVAVMYIFIHGISWKELQGLDKNNRAPVLTLLPL